MILSIKLPDNAAELVKELGFSDLDTYIEVQLVRPLAERTRVKEEEKIKSENADRINKAERKIRDEIAVEVSTQVEKEKEPAPQPTEKPTDGVEGKSGEQVKKPQ